MSTLRTLVKQVGSEQKIFWRNPLSAVACFALPVLLLVIVALVFNGREVNPVSGVTFDQYYVPGILTFSLAAVCFVNLAVIVAYRRDYEIIKHLRGTPIATWVFFAGLVVSALLICGLLVATTTFVGWALFGVRPPHDLAPFALVVTAGSLCFAALGFAAARVRADASTAFVNLILLPLAFLSGVFVPVPARSGLGKIGAIFPLRHVAQAILHSFDPRRHGGALQAGDLIAIAAWTAAAVVFALVTFQWEPRA